MAMANNSFFRCCPDCNRTFTDPYLWRDHLARFHTQRKTRQELFEEEALRKASPQEASQDAFRKAVIVGNDDVERERREDDMLERTRDLQEMKSRLYQAGIECQTLDAEATRRVYAKAMQDGAIQ